VKEKEESWEFRSLKWIHEVREAHFEKTKDLPVESWMPPADPQRALLACERLGLRVKLTGRGASRDARTERDSR
jgi:hypothetical protein